MWKDVFNKILFAIVMLTIIVIILFNFFLSTNKYEITNTIIISFVILLLLCEIDYLNNIGLNKIKKLKKQIKKLKNKRYQ